MKRRLLKGILLFGSIMLLSVGCNNQQSGGADQLEAQIKQLEDENTALKNEVIVLEEKIQVLEQELEEKSQEDVIASEILNVYTIDVNTYEEIIIDTIEISPNNDQQEIIESLAMNLSENVFEGLPILVEEIKEIEGKQVATLVLQEDDTLGVSWKNNFLQGSAGGEITSKSIGKTFLQPEYKGEWIDGIEVIYEDETAEMFQHVPIIGTTTYRN